MTQNYVLTVIAASKGLTAGIVTDLQKLLKKRAGALNLVTLSDGEAADFFFATAELGPVKIELRHYFQGKLLDWTIQSTQYRKKNLLVSDMDSTMIEQECLDELADFAGLKPQVAKITEAAMNGEIDFKAALIQRVALLKGLHASKLEAVYRERIRPTKGARTLVATMKAKGAKTVLVSGGFTYFTALVAAALDFDGQMANRFEIVGDQLTGAMHTPILDKDSKELILRQTAEKLGLPLSLTLAVGDGANDLPMLKAAGLGVAWRAKDVVKKEVAVAIDHGDLTALLYLQGYKREEFVTPKA